MSTAAGASTDSAPTSNAPAPAAASANAAPTTAAAAAASGPAVDVFLPSHTRAWSLSQRAEYGAYCRQHELDQLTPLLTTAPTVPITDGTRADVRAALDATQSFLSRAPASGVGLEAHSRLIQVGDSAIGDFGRGKAWITFDGLPGKDIRVGKTTAQVGGLIGQPYGQVWQVEAAGRLARSAKKRGLETEYLDPTMETSKNNSQLYDKNDSQKLTQADIVSLKASGSVKGEELVHLLIENSATFAQKTEFSQEKYIKKKKARHGTEITVYPSTLAKVLDTLYEKDPKRMRGMRPDTVAMILSYANIQAGTNSLVVESCGGVLLGSILYRQQGLGYVVHGYESNQKKTEGVKRFHFAPEIHQALLQVPLEKLINKTIEVGKATAAPTPAPAAPAADADAPTAMDTSDGASSSTPAAVATAPTAAAAAGVDADLTAEYVLSHQVDVLIVATRYDPFGLLQSLWPYLKPTGRFVIYDEVIETLSHCHAKLCQGGLGAQETAINLVLSETFFRNIQVLPNRTHPFVNMSASGGFVLSGMKQSK